MSKSENHLSTPVGDDRITLEEAIEAYKAWSTESKAYIESKKQHVTHKDFEELLLEVRKQGYDLDSSLLSRLLERFNSIDSHILNEDEVERLIRRYPQIVFEDGWRAMDTDVGNEVDLLLVAENVSIEETPDIDIDKVKEEAGTGESEEETDSEETEGEEETDTEETDDENGRLVLVDVAIESDVEKALGNLQHERERMEDVCDDVELRLVTLDPDDYFRSACRRADVEVVEFNPDSVVQRVEEIPDWGNLRGITLTP
ncbi:MAG: hypothetical protein ABEK59_08935 [Halobacteria archaeon]